MSKPETDNIYEAIESGHLADVAMGVLLQLQTLNERMHELVILAERMVHVGERVAESKEADGYSQYRNRNRHEPQPAPPRSSGEGSPTTL